MYMYTTLTSSQTLKSREAPSGWAMTNGVFDFPVSRPCGKTASGMCERAKRKNRGFASLEKKNKGQ